MSFAGSPRGEQEEVKRAPSVAINVGNLDTDTDYYTTPFTDYLSHEPNFLFKEQSDVQEARIRATSRYSHL